MIVGYIRVSTVEQNDERQRESLNRYNVEQIFAEKISGKDTNRPELQAMLKFVRKGDTVIVHDFSRLARNTKDLLNICDTLTEKGVTLISVKESVDSSTPTGKLMLTMIGAIYEFERANLLERQREGIAIKKAQDKLLPPDQRTYKGRKAVDIPDFQKHYERYLKREVNKSQLAKELKISRPTLDKLIIEYEKTHPKKNIVILDTKDGVKSVPKEESGITFA